MMKKIVVAALFCISLSFAGVADPTQYTSGANEPETPVVNINHVENDEPIFSVSIHPISMLILSFFDIQSVYLTIEGNLNSHMSLITRPYIIWTDFSNSYEEWDVYIFGISEGLRFYFNEGHRGFFASAHFEYDRAGVDYEYKDNAKEDESYGANGIGGYFYVGHKILVGHFTSSFDIGVGFSKFFASGREKDDIEDVSSSGVNWDVNYTIGFAF